MTTNIKTRITSCSAGKKGNNIMSNDKVQFQADTGQHTNLGTLTTHEHTDTTHEHTARPDKLELTPEQERDNTTPYCYNLDYCYNFPDPPPRHDQTHHLTSSHLVTSSHHVTSPHHVTSSHPETHPETHPEFRDTHPVLSSEQYLQHTDSGDYIDMYCPTTTNTPHDEQGYVNSGQDYCADYSVATAGSRREVVAQAQSYSPDNQGETYFQGAGLEQGIEGRQDSYNPNVGLTQSTDYKPSGGVTQSDYTPNYSECSEGTRQHGYSDYVNIQTLMLQSQDTDTTCPLRGSAYVNWTPPHMTSSHHVTSPQEPNYSSVVKDPETPQAPYENWQVIEEKWRIIEESHRRANSSSFEHIEGQIKGIYEDLFIPEPDPTPTYLEPSCPDPGEDQYTEDQAPAQYAEVVLRESSRTPSNKEKRRSNSTPHRWRPGSSSSIYSQGAYTEVKILPPKPCEIDNIEFNETVYRGSRDFETRSRVLSSHSDTELSPKPITRSRGMVGSLRRAGSGLPGLRPTGSLRRKNPTVFTLLRNLTKRFSASESDLTAIDSSSEVMSHFRAVIYTLTFDNLMALAPYGLIVS